MFGFVWPRQNAFSVTLAIEQEQSDIADAMPMRETPAFSLSNVGHQILQFAVMEVRHGVAGFPLESPAAGTLGIVNLDNRGNTVADPRQVVLPRGCTNFIDQIPADPAAGSCK